MIAIDFDKFVWKLGNSSIICYIKRIEALLSHQNVYSRVHNSTYLFCFMKQNCHFQRSMAQCKHATTPLSSYSINTTHQGFQKRYITLLYVKGLKSYQQKCKWKVRFTPFYLVNRTFHLYFCFCCWFL